MADKEYEEVDGWIEDSDSDDSSEYVTKSDLAAAITEALKNAMGGGGGDSDDDEGWEIIDFDSEVDSDLPLSAAELERMMEKKVQEAMKLLAGKKSASSSRPPVKKAAPKQEVERLPDQPGRKKLSERLWGVE